MVEAKLSRDDLATVCADKQTLHDTCLRNGLLMPSRKQQICTMEFIWGVRQGLLWVPKVGEVANAVLVPSPPPKAALVEAILRAKEAIILN